jgi:4-hydroxy-tetrahydrodipicolinate synthase
MARAGADGILSVTPYYNKPTQEGLYQHFRAITEAVGLPIIVYNVPGRTGCNVEVGTLQRIAALTGIVGVKEASGNMLQIVDVCRAVPEDFIVLSGDDALTLPVMSVGGRGVISVVSNEMPAEMAELVEAAESGSFGKARAMHNRLLPLMQVNFVEANPIPVKAALAMMGLLTERYRLPLVPPADLSRTRIASALASLGLVGIPPAAGSLAREA